MSSLTEHTESAPVICPLCGEGTVSSAVRMRATEYQECVGEVELHLSVCSYCGSETINDLQSNLNRRAMNRFKKQIDCIPLGNEIRLMRRGAGLTQEAAGALFGGGPVAFSKYEHDDIIPDVAMSNLLRLAIQSPNIVEQLQALRPQSVGSVAKVRFDANSVAAMARPSSNWVNVGDYDEPNGGESTGGEMELQLNIERGLDQSWNYRPH